MRILMALAEIKWNPQKTAPIEQAIRDPDYLMRIRGDDFSSYWLGYKDGNHFASRPTSSDWLKIDGSYVAMYRKRTIEQKMSIGGNITIKR
jgi:hypothetical protein